MRETIAFFLKDEALRAVAFLVGGGVRARLLCHHLSLQFSTPTYLREKRIKKKLSAWFSDLPAINATSFKSRNWQLNGLILFCSILFLTQEFYSMVSSKQGSWYNRQVTSTMISQQLLNHY